LAIYYQALLGPALFSWEFVIFGDPGRPGAEHNTKKWIRFAAGWECKWCWHWPPALL